MPPTPRKARAAIAAGGAAQALAARMATMQADAGLTIAMRMPILMQGALGDRRGQREAAKAVTEKVTAVLESGFAAGQAGALRSAYYQHNVTPNWTETSYVTGTVVCGSGAGVTTSGCGTAPQIATASFVLVSRGSNTSGPHAPGEAANVNNDRVFVLRPRVTNVDLPNPPFFDDQLVWVSPHDLLGRLIQFGVARP